jgi:hypothetical protein
VTSIHTHDMKANGSAPATLTPLPMAALLTAAWNLLDQACDLPQPTTIFIYDMQSISLQFAPQISSLRAVLRWASRFGGTRSGSRRNTEKGPQIWCKTSFDYHGVAVEAYAHIPAGPATT